MTKVISAFYILFLYLFFTGCDNNRVYEGEKDFEDRYWPKQQQVQFDFEVPDQNYEYNLYYTLRYTNIYPYQNIYLQYYLEDSTGKVVSKELNNILLFNAVTGTPMGDGLGDVITLQKQFLDHYKFPTEGLYNLNIEQFMRLDTLPEILTVGLRLEKAQDESND